jgi:NAD(P)-dependent dehydrogenase (short-subunit alcohol dehydrogenase family)
MIQGFDAQQSLNATCSAKGWLASAACYVPQGVESQLGVNHVGHALLVRLLLPAVAQTAAQPGAPQGRVVVLSSIGHNMAPAHGFRPWDKINGPDGYQKWPAYGQV